MEDLRVGATCFRHQSLTFKHSLPDKNTTRLEGTTVQTVFLTH